MNQRIARIVRRIPKLMIVAYYVYRFFQPKYSMGVVGVVINDAGQVLLVEHVFHPQLPWGLPGGWIGHNENPEDTIVREIQEELNLSVTVEQLLMTKRTEYNHVDVAFVCSPTGTIGTLSYELLGYQWYERDAIPRIHHFHANAIALGYSWFDVANERH